MNLGRDFLTQREIKIKSKYIILFSNLRVLSTMPWQALIWLLVFILQSAILGVSMYQLVQLTDLEADLINPHEASQNYNRLVVRNILPRR